MRELIIFTIIFTGLNFSKSSLFAQHSNQNNKCIITLDIAPSLFLPLDSLDCFHLESEFNSFIQSSYEFDLLYLCLAPNGYSEASYLRRLFKDEKGKINFTINENQKKKKRRLNSRKKTQINLYLNKLNKGSLKEVCQNSLYDNSIYLYLIKVRGELFFRLYSTQLNYTHLSELKNSDLKSNLDLLKIILEK